MYDTILREFDIIFVQLYDRAETRVMSFVLSEEIKSYVLQDPRIFVLQMERWRWNISFADSVDYDLSDSKSAFGFATEAVVGHWHLLRYYRRDDFASFRWWYVRWKFYPRIEYVRLEFAYSALRTDSMRWRRLVAVGRTENPSVYDQDSVDFVDRKSWTLRRSRLAPIRKKRLRPLWTEN